MSEKIPQDEAGQKLIIDNTVISIDNQKFIQPTIDIQQPAKRVYRGDIDGLRALAVLMVVFFHMNSNWIPGGFIGVDIFFVISGYLISSGVHNSIAKDKFSFGAFYSRRLWRLQPLCLLVIFVSLAYVTLVYPPSEYLDFTDSLYWAISLMANFFFASLKSDYMSDNTAVMPLLHFWSLSVEWQWYLCLPLILWTLNRIEKQTRISVKSSFIVVFLMSLGLLMALPAEGPQRYYNFVGRIFEMCMGAIVGISVNSTPLELLSQTVVGSIKAVTVLSLFGIAFIQGMEVQYPNAWTVLVCFLSSLYIYLLKASEDGKADFMTWIMSHKVPIYIGKISYAVYLWHWPILAFHSFSGEKNTFAFYLSYLVIVGLISSLTHHTVELKGMKFGKMSFKSSAILLFFIPGTIIGGINYFNIVNEGYSSRFGDIGQRYTDIKESPIYWHNDPDCQRENLPAESRCIIPGSEGNLIHSGDSFSDRGFQFMKHMAQAKNVGIEYYQENCCLTLPEQLSLERGEEPATDNCLKVVNRVTDLMSQEKNKYFVFQQYWEGYVHGSCHISIQTPVENNDDARIAHIKERVGLAAELAKKQEGQLVLIQHHYTPRYKMAQDQLPAQCAISKIMVGGNTRTCDFAPNWEHDVQVRTNQLFDEIRAEYPDVKIIDQTRIACDDTNCVTSTDMFPVYDDNHHLSHHFFDFTAQKMIEEGNNILD